MKYTASFIFRPMSDKENSSIGEMLLDRDANSPYYGYLFWHNDVDEIVFARTKGEHDILRHIENSLRVGDQEANDPDIASVWYNTNKPDTVALTTANSVDAFIVPKVKADGSQKHQGDAVVSKTVLPYTIAHNVHMSPRFTKPLDEFLNDKFGKVDSDIAALTSGTDSASKATNKKIDDHIADKNNPHAVTLAQLHIDYLRTITKIMSSIPTSVTDLDKSLVRGDVLWHLNERVKALEAYTNKLKQTIHDGNKPLVLQLSGGTMTGNIVGSSSSTITGFKLVDSAIINDYAELFYVGKGKAKEYPVGTVMTLDTESDEEIYIPTSSSFDIPVGVITGEGFIIGGSTNENLDEREMENLDRYVPIGLCGRVRPLVKGTVSKGQYIYVGDEVGIASANGSHVHRIGIALEDKPTSGIGRVRILIRF